MGSASGGVLRRAVGGWPFPARSASNTSGPRTAGVGSSVSRFRAMRSRVRTTGLAAGEAGSDSGEREVPARIAIRASSPGASPFLRAARSGADTPTRSSRADFQAGREASIGSRRELEQVVWVSGPVPLHAPFPTRVQAGCFISEARGIPPEDGVGLTSVERPGQSDGQEERGTSRERAIRPGELRHSRPTIRASMSGPRWNASRKACPPVVSRRSTISSLPKSARQSDRSAVAQRWVERSVTVVLRGPRGDLPLRVASPTRSTCSGPDASRGRGRRRSTGPVPPTSMVLWARVERK